MPKTKIEYSKFTVEGNWSYHDCLDGIEIKAGDVIILKWPNGHTERIHPVVRKSKHSVSEQGSGSYDCPVTRAYFKIDYNGSEIELRMTECKGVKGYFATDVSSRKPV